MSLFRSAMMCFKWVLLIGITLLGSHKAEALELCSNLYLQNFARALIFKPEKQFLTLELKNGTILKGWLVPQGHPLLRYMKAYLPDVLVLPVNNTDSPIRISHYEIQQVVAIDEHPLDPHMYQALAKTLLFDPREQILTIRMKDGTVFEGWIIPPREEEGTGTSNTQITEFGLLPKGSHSREEAFNLPLESLDQIITIEKRRIGSYGWVQANQQASTPAKTSGSIQANDWLIQPPSTSVELRLRDGATIQGEFSAVNRDLQGNASAIFFRPDGGSVLDGRRYLLTQIEAAHRIIDWKPGKRLYFGDWSNLQKGLQVKLVSIRGTVRLGTFQGITKKGQEIESIKFSPAGDVRVFDYPFDQLSEGYVGG